MATYSFLDNVMSITGPGGSFNIGGQGAANAEEGFDIEAVADQNTMTIGADGSPMHSLQARSDSKLTIRLLKTSPVNSMLSSLLNTQKLSSAAWALNIVTIQNTVSGDNMTLTSVAFKKWPKVTYAKDGGTNEWEFDVGLTARSLGGGGTVASILGLVQQSI